MRTVYGVDFSGAEDAGAHTWITRAHLDGGVLRVQDVRPASRLPGGGEDRGKALAALVELVRTSRRSAFGIDAPFGLPAGVVEEESWQELIAAFPKRYADADAMREACRAASEEELRRATDEEAATPFSPYNLRLYKQTYHVIADVLAPLVRDGEARVLPMEEPDSHLPWLLEVCPASTLKREGWYGRTGYKGPGPDRREARLRLLTALERRHSLVFPDRDLRARVLDDTGGDALDSLLAAHAVARTISDPGRVQARGVAPGVEGHVYV